MRVLVVEDDTQLNLALQGALDQAGYECVSVRKKAEGDLQLRTSQFAALLLDLGLPDGSGLDLLAAMRCQEDRTPVMILTARGALDDRVRGLDLGADDYLSKPFAVPELLSRLRALIRRSAGFASEAWTHGDLVLHPHARVAQMQGRPVDLTRKEFDLLLELMRRPGKVVTRDVLEESLRGDGDGLESNALEVHVHRIRRKLGQDFIQTFRGVGYRVRP